MRRIIFQKLGISEAPSKNISGGPNQRNPTVRIKSNQVPSHVSPKLQPNNHNTRTISIQKVVAQLSPGRDTSATGTPKPTVRIKPLIGNVRSKTNTRRRLGARLVPDTHNVSNTRDASIQHIPNFQEKRIIKPLVRMEERYANVIRSPPMANQIRKPVCVNIIACGAKFTCGEVKFVKPIPIKPSPSYKPLIVPQKNQHCYNVCFKPNTYKPMDQKPSEPSTCCPAAYCPPIQCPPKPCGKPVCTKPKPKPKIKPPCEPVPVILNCNDKNFTILTQSDELALSQFCNNKILLNDPAKTYKITIDLEIDFIFITAVAGGGAGGVGFVINNIYISGGGGGAGTSIFKKPIPMQLNFLIEGKVGCGGILPYYGDGQDTYVKVKDKTNKVVESIYLDGGKVGKPCDINSIYKQNYSTIDVIGGCGGSSNFNKMFSGDEGGIGQKTLPSMLTSGGGNGASSHFNFGGAGGGSYFGKGGEGGIVSHINDIICGKDGRFGSGGGGSGPFGNLDKQQKMSGNGGDGFILIEW